MISRQYVYNQPMTKDSRSYYSSHTSRPTAAYISQSHHSSQKSTSSHSHVSQSGTAAIQAPYPPCPPRSMSGSSSGYADTNVTGYRRCLDVPGMPGPDYFSSGESKVYRPTEYIGGGEGAAGSRASSGSAYRSVRGDELVRYKTEPSRYSVDDEGDDEDNDMTVCPDDSISQVSTNRPNKSKRSTHSYRYSPPRGRQSLPRSNTSPGAMEGSASAYGEMRIVEKVRSYVPEKRIPRGR